MIGRDRKAGRLFNKFLKLTLGSYLRLRYNLKGFTKNLPRLTPPYIVLANHPGFWDPFIVSLFIRDPIQFVASDEYFRNPLFKFLLHFVGAIPKSKFISDSETVKEILQVVKNNGVIGIFPEGRRTWDGCTVPLLFATSKLVKKLCVPVVTIKLIGGFLSSPRWAKKSRHGVITVTCSVALDSEQIKKKSVEEIHSVLSRQLAHDEYQYQKNEMIPFKGKNLAENLELFLFTCPRCKSIDTLKSNWSMISCKCGFHAYLDVYGFFVKGSKDLSFKTPLEWNNWQQQNLAEIIHFSKGNIPHIQNKNVICKSGGRLVPFRNAKTGSLELHPDRLVFTSHNNESHIFRLKNINGLNIQYNDVFEFYYSRALYRFSFLNQSISAFKWLCAIKIYQQSKLLQREGAVHEL